MELQGVLEKEHVEFPGTSKEDVEFPGVFNKSYNVEFPRVLVLQGVLEKEHVEISGTTKEDVEFPGVFNKSDNVEFPWVLVFDLDISKPRVATQFCRISRRESLFFFSRISKGKVTNKNSKVFLEKYIYNLSYSPPLSLPTLPLCLDLF